MPSSFYHLTVSRNKQRNIQRGVDRFSPSEYIKALSVNVSPIKKAHIWAAHKPDVFDQCSFFLRYFIFVSIYNTINVRPKKALVIILKHTSSYIEPYIFILTNKQNHIVLFFGNIIMKAVFGSIVKAKIILCYSKFFIRALIELSSKTFSCSNISNERSFLDMGKLLLR